MIFINCLTRGVGLGYMGVENISLSFDEFFHPNVFPGTHSQYVEAIFVIGNIHFSLFVGGLQGAYDFAAYIHKVYHGMQRGLNVDDVSGRIWKDPRNI